MEDGEVGIENAEQDNEKEEEEEVMAIDVDIYMVFSIRSPPNGSTATEEDMSAEWFRWLLPSIPYYSSILFELDHSDAFPQKRFHRVRKPSRPSRLSLLKSNPTYLIYSNRTSNKGLSLAGHYTRPAHGIVGEAT